VRLPYLEKVRPCRCYGDPKQKFSLKIDSFLGLPDSAGEIAAHYLSEWHSFLGIHRALGVTQKLAWFMMHRIRLATQTGTLIKMGEPKAKSSRTKLSSAAKHRK